MSRADRRVRIVTRISRRKRKAQENYLRRNGLTRADIRALKRAFVVQFEVEGKTYSYAINSRVSI